MTNKRLWLTLRLWTMASPSKRSEYARKQNIYSAIGKNVTIMDRKVPLYSQLIRFHNNIVVASNVTFVTHDATHKVLNGICAEKGLFQEVIGCIEIMDNVFIGSNTTILSNIRIGENVIVAAGSVVTKDVPPNSVVAGVPAKVIGSFDQYMMKRKAELYPQEYKPSAQEASKDLVSYAWCKFMQKHGS